MKEFCDKIKIFFQKRKRTSSPKRLNETPSQRKRRKNNERIKRYRENATPEIKEHIKKVNSERKRLTRSLESMENTAVRRERQAARDRERRSQESEDQVLHRRQENALRGRERRANESEEGKAQRRRQNAYMNRLHRQLQDPITKRWRRRNERLNRRNRELESTTLAYTKYDIDAFEENDHAEKYQSPNNSESFSFNIGGQNQTCSECGAYMFAGEVLTKSTSKRNYFSAPSF